MILVSSCLLGVNCRYNGESTKIDSLYKLFEEGKVMPICPEVLGGLETPRPSCEIKICNGERRVLDKQAVDYTAEFKKGAEKSLEIAKICKADLAVLKSRSPSCGKSFVYDGYHRSKLIKGSGFTAEILNKEKIKIFSDEEIDEFLNYISKN